MTPKSDKTANHEFTYRGWKPVGRELVAAVHELAVDCGLKLSDWHSDREPLLSQIISQVESFTPRQLRGLFIVVRAFPYLSDDGLNWDESRYPDDGPGTYYSTREVKALTREIRACVEPRKRVAA
jgi:hypothetical protein